ncbi:MAG: hypothetical protein KGP27_09610 [Hyphomicrobiales bacterium]|nr:hypothetical protein [Hyphomicrobiales bacterium]
MTRNRTGRRSGILGAVAAATFASAVLAPMGALVKAESGTWQPFEEADRNRRAARPAQPPQAGPPPLPAMNGQIPAWNTPPGPPTVPGAPSFPAQAGSGPQWQPPAAPPAPRGGSIERVELVPLPGQPAPAAAGVPAVLRQPPSPSATAVGTLWTGLSMGELEELLAGLDVPPRSPALGKLWLRLLNEPSDGAALPAERLVLVQSEGLWRSGLVAVMAERLAALPDQDDPVVAALKARAALANGDAAAACAQKSGLAAQAATLPKALRGELAALSAYCAVADGDAAAVALAAALARDDEAMPPFTLALLEAHAAGGRQALRNLQPPRQLGIIDYTLLQALGPVEPAMVLDRAEPALLAVLARPATADVRMRLSAGERAAGLGIITPQQLSALWRGLPDTPADPLFRRANLARAIGLEQTPVRRAQGVRTLLNDARRSGLYLTAARAVSASLAEGLEAGDLGPFAETAIEVALAGGDTQRARALAAAAPQLAHWLVLADLLDGARIGELGLARLEDMSRRGRLSTDALHRIAAVLDALDVQVPIPLWDAASRAPQPTSGHLPETGVLPRLDEAARKREQGRAALLVLRTLGPGGADGAHIIALGDSLRALRRAGLDPDARALGFEALLSVWPRAG